MNVFKKILGFKYEFKNQNTENETVTFTVIGENQKAIFSIKKPNDFFGFLNLDLDKQYLLINYFFEKEIYLKNIENFTIWALQEENENKKIEEFFSQNNLCEFSDWVNTDYENLEKENIE